jgi:hypothetical protein
MNLTFFDETQLNSASIALLDKPFFRNAFSLNLKMCRGFLARGGDGGVPDAPLLRQAAALISACRIEPQVPPTAKRAKHDVRRRCPPSRAHSGLWFLNLTFLMKRSSTRLNLPLLMSLFSNVFFYL